MQLITGLTGVYQNEIERADGSSGGGRNSVYRAVAGPDLNLNYFYI